MPYSQGIYQHTHIDANVQHTGEFCVNFLSLDCLNNLTQTINKNGLGEVELSAGGYIVEKAAAVSMPRIMQQSLCVSPAS